MALLVVNGPSLALLKVGLDGALSDLVLWKVPLPTAGGLELGNPYKVPSNSVLEFCMCIWGAVFFSSNGSPVESIFLGYSIEFFVSSLTIRQ